MLLRANGAIERIGAGDGGLALGMFEHATYVAHQVTVEPGNVLVLYSDGITEAENTSGKAFEESGLIDVVTANAKRDPGQIGAEVLAAVDRFAGDARLADDLTALVLVRGAKTD